MDCIDCHNRPSHIYTPPARAVNHLMALGSIDPSLPSAKDLAVYVLETPYSTTKIGTDSIKLVIEDFYAANFPAPVTTKRKAIDQMISEVQGFYHRTTSRS